MSSLARSPLLSAYAARRLAGAYCHSFDEPVTAYLTDVVLVAACAVGRTYCHRRADIFGRFQDGHRIRTSDILHAKQCGAYWRLYTASGSHYVVVTFAARGGRQSLKRWLGWAAQGPLLTPAVMH